jgi:tetratricopeptide (TPR) repeat protein
MSGKGLATAAALLRARDAAGALNALDGVVPPEGRETEFAYVNALCLITLERFEAAMPFLDEVIADSPKPSWSRQARLLMAYAALRSSKPRIAEYELKRLLDDHPPTAQVHSLLGYAAYTQGDIGEATARYEAALELDPRNPTALNALGYILAHTGKDQRRALTYCSRALDADPDNPAYLDSLGWALFRLGQKERARPFLERAFSSAPDRDEIKRHFKALKDGAP